MVKIVEPITRGWSDDKKYKVMDEAGVSYLLRISDANRYEHRKTLFKMMQRAEALDIPMCKPIEFGTNDEGVYSLQSWINGKDLEDVLPSISETEQYALGVKSGKILKQIHSIPAPADQEDWAVRFNRKVDSKINRYLEHWYKFDGDTYLIDYINNNRTLLDNRPQCFHHGDYHTGNMMLSDSGELTITDFDRYDFGDPMGRI